MFCTKSAGGIILNTFGKIAIIDQGGKWGFPKGHLEQGEDLLTAAKREIYEETGLSELVLIKELGSYQRVSFVNPNEQKTIYLFLFTTPQLTLEPIDEVISVAHWVEIEEVADHLMSEIDKVFFLSVKNDIVAFQKQVMPL